MARVRAHHLVEIVNETFFDIIYGDGNGTERRRASFSFIACRKERQL